MTETHESTEQPRATGEPAHRDQPAVGERPPGMTVQIDNIYEDGHRFATVVTVDQPSLATLADDDWWQEVVWPLTGGRTDGKEGLDAGYFAEILEATDPAMVGETHEWC